MREPFRLPSRAPMQAFQTYGMTQRMVPATCARVRCEAHVNGWVTRVPRGSDLEDFIRHGNHGRRYHETTGLGSAEVEFMFLAGQSCFRESQHRAPAEDQRFIVRDGDHRGNPSGRVRLHTTGVDWRDDMGEHLDKIKDQRERG